MPQTVVRKVLTKDTFQAIRDAEVKQKRAFNHGITDKAFRRLKKGVVFPVVSTMLHNDFEVRCVVLVGNDTQKGLDVEAVVVDMPLDLYNNLPTVEVPATAPRGKP